MFACGTIRLGVLCSMGRRQTLRDVRGAGAEKETESDVTVRACSGRKKLAEKQ